MVEYGFEADRVSALLPLLTMSPKLDDAMAWLQVLLGMLKHVPTDHVQWAAANIIEAEDWRPSHAAIRKGIEHRIRHDRMMEQCREVLDAIRAEWVAAKQENPQLIELVGKPAPNWIYTSPPPIMTEAQCLQDWMEKTGRLKKWQDAKRHLKIHDGPFRPTWSERRIKSAKA